MEPKNELQKNAIAEARKKELETYQRALDIQWLNNRMEDGRMGRCLALIQKEAEMEKDFQERTDHAAIVNARAQKEAALGIEIAKVQREKACELLRRHYLRERDPSLRQLMTKLQAGYVCRDLKQQILHNEYRRLQEKVEQQHANSILCNALSSDKDALELEEAEKKKKCSQYCLELQQQLVDRQQQKQCQFEDTLIEKKMLDDIMRTISDEDKREVQQKHEQTEKLRREMETFKQAREDWRCKQREMLLEEERAAEGQRAAAGDRSAAVVAELQRKQQAKDELNKKIADMILADEAARNERDDIIKQLQEQEYLEKNAQYDIEEKNKLERVKTDLKQALTKQMETNKKLGVEQKRRDLEFRKQAEAAFALDNEKEIEKQHKQKEKSHRYSVELLQQIEDNRKRRQKDKQLEEDRARAVWDWAKTWDKEVTQERNKIVEEHAPHLLGYLQAGVLKKEDLPSVRSGANQHEDLAKLDVESLAVSNRPKRYSKCNAQCRILREY